MGATKTLWSDATRSHHFLIPDSDELPSGDFELRTVTGRQKHVDADIIAAYEITHDEAKAWLKGQFGQVVETAKESILDSIRSKMAQEPDLDAWFGKRSETFTSKPESISASKPEAKTDSPALSLFAELSGESFEQLQTDPQSVGRAIQTLFAQLGTMFTDATARDEARIAAARERTKNLRSIMQQHGLNVGEAMENFPDKLREAYRSAEREMDSDEVADRLESLADGLEEAAADAAKWLRGQAKDLRQQQNNEQVSEKAENQRENSASGTGEQGRR